MISIGTDTKATKQTRMVKLVKQLPVFSFLTDKHLKVRRSIGIKRKNQEALTTLTELENQLTRRKMKHEI